MIVSVCALWIVVWWNRRLCILSPSIAFFASSF